MDRPTHGDFGMARGGATRSAPAHVLEGGTVRAARLRTTAGAGAVALALASLAIQDRSLRFFALHLGVLAGWMLLLSRRFPRVVTLVLAAAALANSLGWAWRWLDDVWMYDQLVHALVTFALTLPAALLLLGNRTGPSRPLGLVCTFAVLGVGLSGGLVWELLEWAADHFVQPPGQMDLVDTLADLVADLLGALLSASVAVRLLRRRAGTYALP